MKTTTIALGGLAGSLVMAGVTVAGFTGLTIEPWIGDGWVDNGYDEAELVTWRLWANFDGTGDDGVLSVFGINGVPMSANSADGLFSNAPPGLDRLTAPRRGFLDIWEDQWDTYVTINAEDSDGDATTLSPGFAEEVNSLASNWSTENAAWFVTADDEQSRARETPHGGLGVLLAQFSIADDPNAAVFGTINLLLRDEQQLVGLRFATPAPGALAVLILAQIVGPRRRRR